MWTMLAGVPGKLKTLLDRLTATRAALLDNLNATVGSRAPASSALSNAVWTDTRAGRLDASVLVNGAIKAIHTGWVAQDVTHGTTVKSTEDAAYLDIAIPAVNVGKSIVLFVGAGGASVSSVTTADRIDNIREGLRDSSNYRSEVSGRLTSSTNLRLATTSGYNSTWIPAIVGRWTVIEFA